MAYIVFNPDDQRNTARAHKYEVSALQHKIDLEEQGKPVKYLDLPNVSFRDAQAIVDTMK